MLRTDEIDRPEQSASTAAFAVVAWQPGLPPGARQCDCDGAFDPFADASFEELWEACDERQQYAIAQRFAELYVDDLRDALLEGQQERGESERIAPLQRVWANWTNYRDRALGALCRRGSLRDD
jgi:hypothetical protein